MTFGKQMLAEAHGKGTVKRNDEEEEGGEEEEE